MTKSHFDFVAVDPGESAGYALWVGGVLVESLRVRRCSPSLAKWYLERAADRGVRTLVVEDQYYARNPKAFKTLVERRAEWSVVAQLCGWEVYYVQPSSWQAHHGLTVQRKEPRERHKDRMQAKAGELLGAPLEVDECDAYLLGLYWLQRGAEEADYECS